MGKAKLLYKDKAGNKLFERFIKGRNKWQLFATNAQGRLVTESDVIKLARKSGRSLKRK